MARLCGTTTKTRAITRCARDPPMRIGWPIGTQGPTRRTMGSACARLRRPWVSCFARSRGPQTTHQHSLRRDAAAETPSAADHATTSNQHVMSGGGLELTVSSIGWLDRHVSDLVVESCAAVHLPASLASTASNMVSVGCSPTAASHAETQTGACMRAAWCARTVRDVSRQWRHLVASRSSLRQLRLNSTWRSSLHLDVHVVVHVAGGDAVSREAHSTRRSHQ